MNKNDIKIVADDLNYLATWNPDISEGDIRRGSAVLRRLLVDGVYGKAWRAIGKGKQPNVVAIDISSLTEPNALKDIKYVVAAGAKFRGADFAVMLVNKGTRPIGNLGPPMTPDGYPGEREFSLTEFVASPSGAVDGRVFLRREVIQYIANVRGGVHQDDSGKTARKLTARLGKIERKLAIADTDALLVEIVAIAQAVARASDTAEFVKVADAL